MILLEKSGVITPDMDKTNIAFEFDAPDDFGAITADFSYAPKTLEDEDAALRLVYSALKRFRPDGGQDDPHEHLPVKNLITLSFDDPNGYRGAAHRQPNEQHIRLCESGGTPGFYNRKNRGGKWRVMLNIHCCVSDVRYTLKIEGGEEK